jgi:hypothetical protein
VLAHKRKDGAAGPESAKQIHVELAPRLVDRCAFEWTRDCDPGVVREYVQAALAFCDGFDGFSHGMIVRHIHAEHRKRARGAGWIPRGPIDAEPVLRKKRRASAADAG